MDGKNGMILWVLGGAGILFLYSAYKAKSPQEVLRNSLNGATGPQTATPIQEFPGTRNTSVPVNYQIVPDITGSQNVYQNGQMVGQVPDSYAGSPGTYIPSVRGGLIET